MNKKQILAVLLLGSFFIVLYTFLQNFTSALSDVTSFLSTGFTTITLGFITAFILNIPVSFIERLIGNTKGNGILKKYSRFFSIVISLVCLIALCAALLMFIIPSLTQAVGTLVSSIDSLIYKLNTSAEGGTQLADLVEDLLAWLGMSIEEAEEMVTSYLKDSSPAFIRTTINTIMLTVSSIVTFFIALIFAVYFISSKELLSRHVKTLISLVFSDKTVNRMIHIASLASSAFSRFISAQVTEAAIIGILCTVGMLIFRLPDAAAVGVLTGITALVPVYGAYAGAVFGALIIAASSPIKAVFFIVFIIILQQLEGNLIYPKVVGGSMGLPSVYTFTLVTLSGALFGIAGMLFVIPLGSICFTLLKEYRVSKHAEKEKCIMSGKDGEKPSGPA